jgi:hypothetical protein
MLSSTSSTLPTRGILPIVPQVRSSTAPAKLEHGANQRRTFDNEIDRSGSQLTVAICSQNYAENYDVIDMPQ